MQYQWLFRPPIVFASVTACKGNDSSTRNNSSNSSSNSFVHSHCNSNSPSR